MLCIAPRTCTPPPKNRRRRRGLAAVEFALLLPLLAFLFVITVDYARVFYYSLTVTNCARSGAIYGCQKPANALDTAGIAAIAKKDVGTLNATLLKVTSTVNSSTNPTTLSVTATYTFSTITGFPGITTRTGLARTVKVNVAPLTPN